MESFQKTIGSLSEKTDFEILKEAFDKIGVEYTERSSEAEGDTYQYLLPGVKDDESLDTDSFLMGEKFFEFCNGKLDSY